MFYATYDQHFPSESEERAGYWVGCGEHCGDAMTHKILDHDTQKIIYRSVVRPKKSSTPNHRLAPHGEKSSPVSGLNKRCQRCEGATNSQIRRSGQNKLFCPLLASGMLLLTITRALVPEPRLGAKTTLHYNSFGLLKMCPPCSQGHTLPCPKPLSPPWEEVGNP